MEGGIWSCVVYLIREDMTFAFIQLIKPFNDKVEEMDRNCIITHVAVHESLGIIGMSFGNKVFCYAPTLLKYEVKDENGDDNIFRTHWQRCATLSLGNNISCISWMPGIKSVGSSNRFNRSKIIVLATACKELTLWECTLSQEAQADNFHLKSSTMDKMLLFNKRYSTPVFNTITCMAYSHDGLFLALINLNSRFAKVLYEYEKFADRENFNLVSGKNNDTKKDFSNSKNKTSYGFGYLPHPKCVYDVSWKPYAQNSPSNVNPSLVSNSHILLTNCHDGTARIWVPIYDSGIFKFCLVSFIQSNPIEAFPNSCYEIKVDDFDVDLKKVLKKPKKKDVIYNPVVWMPLCTNARDYRRNSKQSDSPKTDIAHINVSSKNSNINDGELLGSAQKNQPFYDFIDLGKKQLDTGQPTLFQIKRDSTILFCKFEGYSEKIKSYSRSGSHICGLSCLKNNQNSSTDTWRSNMRFHNVYTGEKSLKPKIIMCALNNPCEAFIDFCSGSSVMPYLFVNPEPLVIEYNNIVLLEKVLLICVKNNGHIQAFTLFIKVRMENLWVIPRIVPLQSFFASCDLITNIWPHSNVDIPLLIIVSRMYNGAYGLKHAVTHTISIHYGPISAYSSLIAVLKIEFYSKDYVTSVPDEKEKIHVEWIQSSPTFVVWGNTVPRPLVYMVKIPNNTNTSNVSPTTHQTCSRGFDSGLFSSKTLLKSLKTKKRRHKSYGSNVFYTLESGVTFMGYIPTDYFYSEREQFGLTNSLYESNDNSEYNEDGVYNPQEYRSNECKGIVGDPYTAKSAERKLPSMIMLKAFDSASHIGGIQPSDAGVSLYFKSGIMAVFSNGYYSLWNMIFDKVSGYSINIISTSHLPNISPDQVIKGAEHLFSPCEFFQLSFTLGYHLFAVVAENKSEKNSLLFYKYGTSHIQSLDGTEYNEDTDYMKFLGENCINQDIKVIKGDMLEFSCTIGKLHNGTYCMSIWKISEEGTYRRLVYCETFEDEIVSADWLVMSSSQVILAIAQRNRVMVYCRLNRAIDGGKKLWTRIDPYTAKCSEKIYSVKWIPSDCCKLAVITDELVFLLDDHIDNWNLPVCFAPLPEIKSRINLSLFSEVDTFEEQPCNYDVYKLYHHTLLGNLDYVNYALKMLYYVIKNAPHCVSMFQRVCLLWIFERRNVLDNSASDIENALSGTLSKPDLLNLNKSKRLNILSNKSDFLDNADRLDDYGSTGSEEKLFLLEKDFHKSSFSRADFEYVKKHIEENDLKDIGHMDAEQLLNFMEVNLLTRELMNKFGMNSLRYIVSMLMNRKCKRDIYSVGPSVYIWAFLSKSKIQLIEWVKSFYGGRMSWKNANEAGIGWWVSDKEACTDITELIARTEFVGSEPGQKKCDPSRCMLFYAIMGKKGVLNKMWEIAKEHPEAHIMQIFLTLDLSIPKNRTIIQKNAFGLISKGRFMDAATLFVLIGKIHEAANICAKKLNDTALALLICKVYDGTDGNTLESIIQRILLPISVENGNRFEACMLFHMLMDYERSVLSVIVPLQVLLKEYNKANDNVCRIDNGFWNSVDLPVNQPEKELLMDPLIYTLFRGLMSNYSLQSESANKHLQDHLPGFILQSTSRYESVGMYYIAFGLARHIMWDYPGLFPFIYEHPIKGIDGKMENTLIVAVDDIAKDACESQIPKCENNNAPGQFWDILAMEFDNNANSSLSNVSSLAKLTLWRLALRFIKDFCVSIDIVTTKLVDPFFSALLGNYTKICISYLSTVIKLIEIPYSVVSRTVIMLCRNLNITGVFPILQIFIEGSQFLREDVLPVPIESHESALFDEFTSLVFTVCHRQITILLNVYSLRMHGSFLLNMKATERGRVSMHMQRQWVMKAAAIARQTLLSIVMCKNSFIGIESDENNGNDHYDIPVMSERNKIIGNALFNYATMVELFFTIFVSLLEESMLDNQEVLLDLVEAIPNLFSIVYRIYSLKSSDYDESSSVLFTEVDNILTNIFMNNNGGSSNSASASESLSDYINENTCYSNSTMFLDKDEVECLVLGFLKINVLSYVISELDKFLGNLVTEMENPLNDDIYWFILELIARPLNRALCDMQLDYAYFCATQMVLKLETMKKFLKSSKLRALFDYMFKVQDVPYIYEITNGLSGYFNIMHPKNSFELYELPQSSAYQSGELKLSRSLKIFPYVSCSHRLVHFHDGNMNCFAVNQANNDIVVVASNDVVDEVSISEISCIMKSASSLSSVGPLKKLVKKFEISKNNLFKDSGSQAFGDIHKRFPKLSVENKSLSSSSIGRMSSSLKNTYRTSDYHLRSTQGKIPQVTSLDSHPSLSYYIQCINGSGGASMQMNDKDLGLNNSFLGRQNTNYDSTAYGKMPYIQLAHFGKQKPLVKFYANCSYLTKCKFDQSGARFGAVGISEKVFVCNFDSGVKATNHLVDYNVKIMSPNDIIFMESSSIVCVAGEGGSNENNIAICDFLLPVSRCIVNEYKTPSSGINCLTYYPNNKLLFAGGNKGKIYVYDVRKKDSPLKILSSGSEQQILSLCIEESVSCLLSGNNNNTIDVWDIKNMKLIDSWKMACATVLQTSTQPKNRHLNLVKDEHHKCSIIEIKTAKHSGDVLACSNHGCLWKCRFFNTSLCSHVQI